MIFEQNEMIIADYKGNRLVKCTLCGKVDIEDNFSIYGGIGQLNKGKCTECIRKIDGYKERSDIKCMR